MGIVVLVLLILSGLTACASPGPGPITFGPVDDPATTFPLDAEKEIAWTAFLPKPVEETSVQLVISPEGSRAELFGHRQFVTDPDATTLTSEMPIGRFIPNPGRYVMRYIGVDGEVLAEGEFELVP